MAYNELKYLDSFLLMLTIKVDSRSEVGSTGTHEKKQRMVEDVLK
jgi:hypothetical protein